MGTSTDTRIRTARAGLAVLILVVSGSLIRCGGPALSEPEQMIEKYFEAVESQQLDDLLPLYSAHFFEKTSREDWKLALVNVRQSLGELQSYRVQKPLQPREDGQDGRYRATLVYVVQYSKYKAEETITVYQEPSGGALSILEHNIRYLEGS